MIDKEMMIWIQNGNVVKGELDFKKGIVTFFDKFDNVALKRTGLTRKQMAEIKKQIEKQLNKRSKVGLYYV